MSHSSVECIFFVFDKWKKNIYSKQCRVPHSSWCLIFIILLRFEIAIIFGSFYDRVCKLTFAMFSVSFLHCNWFSKCTEPACPEIHFYCRNAAMMLTVLCVVCSLFQKWVNWNQKCSFKNIFLHRSNSKYELELAKLG